MARLFRDLRVFGWLAPSTRSQSASVRLYSGIALAGCPAVRWLIARLFHDPRVSGWSVPCTHSNSGAKIVINETPALHPVKRSRQGRSYSPDDFRDVPRWCAWTDSGMRGGPVDELLDVVVE